MLIKKIYNAPKKIQSMGVGRYTVRTLKGFGVRPNIYFACSRLIKTMLEPWITARSFANRKYVKSLPANLSISNKEHVFEVPGHYLTGVDGICEEVNTFFEKHKNSIMQRSSGLYTNLLPPIIDERETQLNSEEQDLLRRILKFASQPTLIGLAAKYIGQVPAIHNFSLNFVKNDAGQGELSSSQLYHRDMGCERLLHLIVQISPCGENDGPFSYISGEKSELLIKKLGHTGGRVADKEIYKHVSVDDVEKVTGPSGTVVFLNPYKCFHFGARNTGGDRLQLIVSYAPPNAGSEGLNCLYLKKYKRYFENRKLTVSERHLLKIY